MNAADRIADLSMIWKQASLVFPYFDRRAIDWDQAYYDYLPRAAEAKSEREFHLLLAEFMNLLGDGHTDYLFPRSLQNENGYVPFTLRCLNDGYCVDSAVPEFEKMLWARVMKLNGIPFEDMLTACARYGYHSERYLSRYRLHQLLPFFLRHTGNEMENDQGKFYFDLLEKKPDDFIARPLTINERYQKIDSLKSDIRLYDDILYVRLDDFLYAKAANEVREALLSHPAVHGVILDIRENIGGMTMYAARVAELFIAGIFHACKKRTRSMKGIDLASASQISGWSAEKIEREIASGLIDREEVERSQSLLHNAHFDEYEDSFGKNGQAALFNGSCVLLTSRHTVSAAEDFTAMFKSNRRAVIMGTPTAGTTGTPLLQKLRCGGSMRICTVSYRLSDGTEFIGCGIQPDAYAEITADDLRSGRDTVLEKALKRIRKGASN